jgi:outer membrane protein TolC
VKRKRRRVPIGGLLTIAVAGASLCSVRLAAQEPPLRLTLQEAVALAERNSHRVAESQARVDAATAVEAGRDAADLPVISARGGYTRTNHVDPFAIVTPLGRLEVLYPDVPDNYQARLDLQWPIYTAGRIAALERSAGAEREAAAFDVAALRADVRLEATRAFWALVTADETERVLASSLESADARVRELRARLDQGLIPPNEVLTAEARRSRERLLAIEARNRRAVAEADLRRIIGDDSRRAIEAAAVLDLPAAPDRREAGDLLSQALERRAERRALARRADAARERERAAAAGGLPQVAIGAGYDYARPNPRIFPRADVWQDSWDVSVNVSWALWDGGRRRAEEAEAAAGTRALLARASDFDRQLAFEIEQQRLEVDSSRAAIETAEDGVRAAVEAQRVLVERFAVGVATSTEVLDGDTAVLQARLDRTRAIANARLALARLERALGR